MLYEILGTLAYFGVSVVVLVIGFVVLDLMTPGRLRDLVFIEHLPNAALIAGAQQIALGVIIVSAILHSSADLLFGLLDVVVFAGIGLVLQTGALVLVEWFVPGRFRDLVVDPKPRSGVFVAATTIIVVGAINAACLT